MRTRMECLASISGYANIFRISITEVEWRSTTFESRRPRTRQRMMPLIKSELFIFPFLLERMDTEKKSQRDEKNAKGKESKKKEWIEGPKARVKFDPRTMPLELPLEIFTKISVEDRISWNLKIKEDSRSKEEKKV